MRVIFAILIVCAECVFAIETEQWETLLSARIGKWEAINFKRYYINGRVVSYTWERKTDTRDRRIPGIYTEDVHTFFSARAQGDEELPSNVTSVETKPNHLKIAFRFDDYTGRGVSILVIDATSIKGVVTVAFSGSGSLFDEFMQYIQSARKDAEEESRLTNGGDLEWRLNEEDKS